MNDNIQMSKDETEKGGNSMEALNDRIRTSGMKKSFIAEKLGLTPQSFSNRLKGITEFTASEVVALIDILSLTSEEVSLFFGRKCE